MSYVIAGGGTGGHVYPAIAIGEEIVRRGSRVDDVHFVGSKRGIEKDSVPEAGFEITLLPGRGIVRGFSLANVGAVFGLVRAFLRSFRLLGKWKPEVVIGVGGYASAPVVVAARLRGYPTVVHEQNAVPGLANKVAVFLGAYPAVTFEKTKLRKAWVTGNPVRAAFRSLNRTPKSGEILAFGGSLGSRTINNAILELANSWRDRKDRRIIHIAGRRDYAELMEMATDLPNYEIIEYENDMASRYATASIAVSRSGAVTVAELATVGLPAILVPLPNAPGDHQRANARAMASTGGAVMIEDKDCSAESVGKVLDEILDDPNRLLSMNRQISQVAKRNAVEAVVNLVEKVAR